MVGQPTLEIFKHAFSENKDPSLLAFMTWAFWYHCNQLRFNKMDCLLSQITHLSRERKVEFQHFHPVRILQQHRQHTIWKPPDQGSFKVNYDGAILVAQGRAGLGVIIRNSDGAVMTSLT